VKAPYHYDRYVLVSQTQFDQVRHLEFRRIAYIPNGVHLDRFGGAKRKLSNELVVGRLSTLRDHKIEPEWPQQLASFEVPKSRFVIAGDGELLPQLRANALGTRIGNKFSFPGYIPHSSVPGLLQQFDVFCYSTSTAVECHPLALLEALASGLPIVAQARGGITEIVQHGVNGLLARSTAEIGDHLHRIQRDARLRERLAAGAVRSAQAFSVQRQIGHYRTLLANLAAELR
jgi:glycosyltransferase involved in cell wall biosynthesis